ncbi:MAG: ribonuclease J [Patescibacteria group bacterium]
MSLNLEPKNQTPVNQIPSEQIYSKKQNFFQQPKDDKLKIIVLGGLEEVGINMTVLEYKDNIIIIDMGLQFPDEDMPGIDYIIPNISYLKGKEKNIKGVIITHGHYDHIGAIPHLIPELGNPIIFGTPLSLGIIQKRQEDFQKDLLKLKVISSESVLHLGYFKIEFFKVSHNIPDCVGIIVHTPHGIVVHTGDFKFDLSPMGSSPTDMAKIATLYNQNVLALLSDSTNAESPGHQISEKNISETLEHIFHQASGRIIIGTFASLLGRIQQIIWLAEKIGRKVLAEGYGMKSNIEIAQKLGYLKVKKGTLINIKEFEKIPDDKIIILCTGAQGEGKAALMRIVNKEHKKINIKKGDAVIFSSSVIPGNERMVQKLKDSFYRQGAEVIHCQMMDVHAGGHAKQEDLKLLLKLINPKYFIPIEGNHSFLRIHAKIAEIVGIDPKNIFVAENGQIMEFSNGQGKLTNKKVLTDYVMVDGLGVGDSSNVVLRDRKVMAEDGMLVVISTIDSKTGKLINNPDIISRGFVYMKENKELIERVRSKVKKILTENDPRNTFDTYLKDKIRNDLGQFLYTKTQKRPMILPVLIEV